MNTKQVADKLGKSLSWVKIQGDQLNVKKIKRGNREWREYSDKDVLRLEKLIEQGNKSRYNDVKELSGSSTDTNATIQNLKEQLEREQKRVDSLIGTIPEMINKSIKDAIEYNSRSLSTLLNNNKISQLESKTEQPKKSNVGRFLAIIIASVLSLTALVVFAIVLIKYTGVI